MKDFDAILIPGGGVRRGGELPTWVRSRLDRALDYYRGEFLIPLSAGTTHRPPPLDEAGFPIFESIAMANYLVSRGVAPERILAETISYDTIGNAYFARLLHTDPLGLRRLLVINSDFHMPRTEAIFQWIFSLDPSVHRYSLHFESVRDPHLDENARSARLTKEYAALQSLARVIERVRSIAELHRWLYTEHAAYAVPIQRQTETLSSPTAATY